MGEVAEMPQAGICAGLVGEALNRGGWERGEPGVQRPPEFLRLVGDESPGAPLYDLRVIRGLWRRWSERTANRVRYYGNCPVCGHDWREHPGGHFDADLDWDCCGECQYEVDHGERVSSAPVCRRRAEPPPARPVG
jgi:hypothetical protein